MSNSATLSRTSGVPRTSDSSFSSGHTEPFVSRVPGLLVRNQNAGNAIRAVNDALSSYSRDLSALSSYSADLRKAFSSIRSEGTATQTLWLAKLQGAARRIQAARDDAIDLPGRDEFASARLVLEATGIPTGWSLGVLPDGEGGLEIRFHQAKARKHISVTLAEDEMSANCNLARRSGNSVLR